MLKKAMICFLKDRWLVSILYFSMFMMIVLFYQLTTSLKVEVLYPGMIAISGYVIWMLIEGSGYIRFFIRLEKSKLNPQYALIPSSEMQQEVSGTIHYIHRKYIHQINEINIENTNHKRFLSQWIHSLKTPISVIDLVAQKAFDDIAEATDALTSISEENQKLNHRVEQLLNLIRLEEFARDYVPEVIHLQEELVGIINAFKKQFIINHVYPELVVKLEDAVVFSDKKWHRVMLEQFLTNAIKYSCSEKGNKKIRITLGGFKEQVILVICDEGIGIPEHDLFRIFEPFFTGENGRLVNHSTGVGLYIADMIAEKLKHTIEITSEVGKGTTVRIQY